jgi:CO/xanthine dehydrogenase Mo-binding subunit
MASLLNIGQPAVHVEGVSKVTGHTKYTADIALPGMLWGKCLRSPYPHAQIVSIDTSAARRLSGVHAVLTSADLPDVFLGRFFFDAPLLARERVRFVGDKVAAVAADSAEIAEAALRLIEVEYEELPAVFDPLAAIAADAPRIHDDPARYAHMPLQPFHGDLRIAPPIPNCSASVLIRHGDIQAGWAQAQRVLEHQFYVPGIHQGYLEPHASAAWIEPGGKINIWLSSKTPFVARNQIASALDIPAERIRVDARSVGGDFGAKGSLMDSVLAYFLAKAAERPVKIVMTYTEELMAAAPRHAAVITQRTGVDGDGRITAHQARVVYDSGAYAAFSPSPMLHGVVHCAGAYRIPNIEIEGLRVYTNTLPRGYMRAPGAPQVMFAVESHMDMVAHAIGMEPLEFRRRNILSEGDHGALGQQWRNILAPEVLEAAVKAARWQDPKPRHVGRGIALYERGTGAFGPSGITLTAGADGRVTLTSGAPDTGTGFPTMLQQVAAEALQLPLSAVEVNLGDTDHAPFETGHAGSRFTYTGGQATLMAARELRTALTELAAAHFGCQPAQVEMKGGRFHGPESSIDLKALMAWAAARGGAPLTRTSTFVPKGGPDTTCFTAQIAEVEVDPETGKVTLRKMVTAHDTGTVINPLTLQGQIEGGLVQGIGQSLTEQLVIRDGSVTNVHLGDYKLPTARDIPELETVIIESNSGPAPFGSKAIGEHSTSAVPAAIANAVFDAVGVRITDLPITAEKIHAALKQREGNAGAR